VHGDVVQVLIALHDMAANQRPKLVGGDAQFLSCFDFGILRFCETGDGHFYSSVAQAGAVPNRGESLISTTVSPDVLMYYSAARGIAAGMSPQALESIWFVGKRLP
jgi:hypothetical protein